MGMPEKEMIIRDLNNEEGSFGQQCKPGVSYSRIVAI